MKSQIGLLTLSSLCLVAAIATFPVGAAKPAPVAVATFETSPGAALAGLYEDPTPKWPGFENATPSDQIFKPVATRADAIHNPCRANTLVATYTSREPTRLVNISDDGHVAAFMCQGTKIVAVLIQDEGATPKIFPYTDESHDAQPPCRLKARGTIAPAA